MCIFPSESQGGHTLVMEDKEKVQLVNALFASVFAAEAGLQESQTLRLREEGWRNEDFLVVRERLGRFNIHKSLGPDRMHSWVWGSWQMLLSHSSSSLKNNGEYDEKCLMTGGKKREMRRAWETHQSVWPPFLERWWNGLFWRSVQAFKREEGHWE